MQLRNATVLHPPPSRPALRAHMTSSLSPGCGAPLAPAPLPLELGGGVAAVQPDAAMADRAASSGILRRKKTKLGVREGRGGPRDAGSLGAGADQWARARCRLIPLPLAVHGATGLRGGTGGRASVKRRRGGLWREWRTHAAGVGRPRAHRAPRPPRCPQDDM